MAWIEKRANGYRVVWRDGEGRDAPKQSRGAPDKRTAEALRRRIEQDLALYGRVGGGEQAAPPLHARLDAWLDALALTVRPATASKYGDACTLFLRYLVSARGLSLDAIPVSALTRESLVGFQSWLRTQGRSLTTVAHRAKAIRLAWEWLRDGEDRRWLEEAPRRIATRRPPLARPIVPTWAEADAAVLCTRQFRVDWVYAFALLARYTGLRRAEVIQVEWADIDGDVLILRGESTKGQASGRRLPLSPHLVAELARLPRRGRWVVDAPPNERAAAEGTARGHIDRFLRTAWERAGVAREKWHGQPCHSFRKTFQTEVEAAGVRRDVVEYLVGHQPKGTGARHYLDAERALWPELLEAVRRIPPLPEAPPLPGVVPFRGAP
jgi:integrase